MAKKKISGVSEALAEQMKERLAPIPVAGSENEGEPEKKKKNENRGKEEKGTPAEAGKVRKNFYIEKHLAKLLRKMAYEQETDQTWIVNSALESYFKEHGYIKNIV